MVFEHLFPDALLERKEWAGFVLAFIYATLAIIISRLLFPANSGIVSVIFVSIFLIPYFSTLLRREERRERTDAYGSLYRLLADNTGPIRTYVAVFLGIYVAYMLYTFLSPWFGYNISTVFREQLSLEGIRGGAVFSGETFAQIVLNNWWVLLACFLVALVAGDGAIFFVAWNASAWGSIFGYRALAASGFDGTAAIGSLLIIVLITLPHLLLEGGAYILAAIAGGVISDEIVEKTEEVRGFVVYFLCAVLLYIVVHMLLRAIVWQPLLRGALGMLAALAILYAMHFLFSKEREMRVFRFNFYLFVLAICVFIVGALLETFVLLNATPLRQVYLAAMLGG